MMIPPHKTLKNQIDGENSALLLELSMPISMDYFNGHFDNNPILPAVAQLFMVKQFAKQFWELPPVCLGVKQLKFKSPIRPSESVLLHMNFHKVSQRLTFSYHESDQLKSKGTLIFSDQTDHE